MSIMASGGDNEETAFSPTATVGSFPRKQSTKPPKLKYETV